MKSNLITFLRWSEKYTKTDMVYLASGGFWLSLERGGGMLFSLILGIALGNLLVPDDYGVYKYIISTGAIIGALSLGGLAGAINQATARGYDGSMQAAAKYFLRWSPISICVSLAVALYYYWAGNQLFAIAFAAAAFTQPLWLAGQFYAPALKGKSNFKTYAKLQLTRELVFVTSLIAIAAYTENILWLILGYFLVQTATMAHAYWLTLRRHLKNTLVDPAFYQFGWHLSAMKLFTTISRHLDKIIIFQLLGPAQLAIYAFALLPIEKLTALKALVVALTLSRFAKQETVQIKKRLFSKLLIIFILSCVLAIIYIIIAPKFFDILLPEYISAIYYSQILALSLLTLPNALLISVLTAKKRVRELHWIYVIDNIIRIALSTSLTYKFGMMGAIFAQIIPNFITLLLLCVIVFANKNRYD